MGWQLFDRIAAWVKQLGAYRHESLFTNQSNLLRIMAGGEFLDFSNQNSLLQQTNLQINRLERYKDFDQMDEVGEITLALDMYCLHGDTRVPLLNGTCPTIAELADYAESVQFDLIAYDEKNSAYVAAVGRNAHISGRDAPILGITFDDGLVLKCTYDHKIQTVKSGMVKAKDLVAGDQIVSYPKSQTNCRTIVAVRPAGQADCVYDLTVDTYHNFAAGTIDSWVIVSNSDEASLIDPEHKHTLMVRAKNTRVKDELDSLFHNTLMIDDWIRPATRYLCKTGDLPCEIVTDQNREGVTQLRHMNVYNFTRVETKFGDLVGFFYQNELVNEPTFFHPWQVMHARLTSFESQYAPYGRSILDGARKHFKQLRLMEDAALIYRITRAPEKRVFTIPVGNIPAKDVPQYIELIARQLKKKKIFDPASGDVNERWSPLIQEDDYYMPSRAGEGPTVDTLPGAQNLDEIADIEYFKKKMVAALKIPFSRVGIGEASDTSGEPLYKTSPEFSKAIHYVQKTLTVALSKVAIIHLVLRGFNADDIKNFDLHMTVASAIDELYRMETWATRASVMESLKNLELFPDEWILRRFTDMTDDEIAQMAEDQEEQEKKTVEAGKQLGLASAGLGDELGGGIGGLPPLEGLDAKLERQVMMEYIELKEQKRKRQKNKIKYGKNTNHKFSNYFDKLLNEEELAKLPYNIDDEHNKPKLMIIESAIPSDLNKSTIAEARKLIMGKDNENHAVEDEDVNNSDLPA